MSIQNEIEDILSASEINGGRYWSRSDGDIHAPSGFSTIDVLNIRYNLFYYVYILSKYKITKDDKRFQDALNILIEKADNNKVFPETPHNSWRKYSFAQKNKYSEYATNRFLEIFS